MLCLEAGDGIDHALSRLEILCQACEVAMSLDLPKLDLHVPLASACFFDRVCLEFAYV